MAAAGVALLGALVASGYRAAVGDRLDGVPREAADSAREGIADAVEAAPATGGHAQDLVRAARESFVEGRRQAMWAGVAVMAVLLVHVALRGPDGPHRAPADEGEDAEAAPAR
ncbi:hypothetical protein [Streptomyces sp. NPDC093992]|uniref:hypothetical protein n=1 Tax=Streptomyces sp. NPDC093992 TaxID=3366053 RepID=UPI00383917A9